MLTKYRHQLIMISATMLVLLLGLLHYSYGRLLQTNAIEHEKNMLQDTVDNFVNEIQGDYKSDLDIMKRSINNLKVPISNAISFRDEDEAERSLVRVNRLFNTQGASDGLSYIMFADSVDQNGYRILSTYPANFTIENFDGTGHTVYAPFVTSITLRRHNVTMVYGYTKEALERHVETSTRQKIYGQSYYGGAYIWINKILNPDGGDGYAIRLIHPNLPDTEGMLLSTNMQDSDGRFPYRTELNGVLQDGSFFQTYTFKELNSNRITEKLSYSRLLPNLNWIVSTGINTRFIRINAIRNSGFMFLITFLTILFVVDFLFLFQMLRVDARISMSEHEQRVLVERMDASRMSGQAKREYGEMELKKALDSFHADGKNSGIMLMDIDLFKSIAATFGQEISEKLQGQVLETVENLCRPSDVIVQWSQNEYLGIFAGASAQGCGIVAEKVRKAIEETNFKFGDNEVKVTASIGITMLKKEDMAIGDILKRADIALSSAREKTNTVVVNIDARDV